MKKLVSILLPAYNEEESIPLLRSTMLAVAQANSGYRWEFLLVNDGSTDGTLAAMERLHEEFPHLFGYIDLSRNYGKEAALMAGIDHAQGDALIIMDADMQHPAEVIPQMLAYWEQGFDDVYAERQGSKETWMKRKTSQAYYKILQKTTRVAIQPNTGDFRLIDRRCIDALRQMRETDRNTKGMFSWIGFRKKAIAYQQRTRQYGKTKWGPAALVDLALNGITSFTTAPLRMASLFGLVVSLLAFVYLIFIILKTLIMGEPVQGYPTLMVTILFLGGIQLISLGIIGEYLGHIFNETKGRPAYLVRTYQAAEQTQ